MQGNITDGERSGYEQHCRYREKKKDSIIEVKL